jgi:predicted DCC family thiol-disulfide oxidoreductase YuxK
MKNEEFGAVVIFDGECGLCDGAVNFIIDRDPARYFRFAARQSDAGVELLRAHGLPLEGLESLVLLEQGRGFLRSEAALRIARRLRAPWPLLHAFIGVPQVLRDAVYGVVSRNRKRFGGGVDACAIPSPERRARLVG